jgi:hypothetical protein
MMASSEVVVSNLAYVAGAVVLAIIGGLIVWLRHRQPKSVDANVESFHRGLRALAPDASHAGSGRTTASTASGGLRIQPRPAVEADLESAADLAGPADTATGGILDHDGLHPVMPTHEGDPGPAVAPMAAGAPSLITDRSYPEPAGVDDDGPVVRQAGAETG